MFEYMNLFKVLCIGNSNTGKSHFLKSIELRLKHSLYSKDFNHNYDSKSNLDYVKFNTKSEEQKEKDKENEKFRQRTYSVDSTRGVDFFHKYFRIDNRIIKIHFWDICGSERFKDVMKVYFCIGDCILYFFNVDDLQSLRDLKCWSDIIDKKWNTEISDEYKIHDKNNEKTKDNRYKLIVGNVQNENNRVVSYKKGYEFAKSLGCDYIEFNDTKLDTHLICKKIIKNIKKKNDVEYHIDTLEFQLINDASESESCSDNGSYPKKESVCNKLTNTILEYTNCCFDRGYLPIFKDDNIDIYDLSIS